MATRLPILAPNGQPARAKYSRGHRRHYRQLDPFPNTRETIVHQPPEPTEDVFDRARNAGREIYNEFPVARGIVNEISRFITSKLSTQYVGADAAWGELASAWLTKHDRIIDFRGRPYDAGLLRFDCVRAPFADNMIGVYFTEDSFGAPKLQCVTDDHIESAIRNRFGTLVGYKTTLREDPISINDIHPIWVPGFHVAGRALSPLSLCRWTWLDIGNFERNELFAGRLNASRVALITNADGEGDLPTDDLDDVTTEDEPVYQTQEFDGGFFDYIKGSENIQAFDTGQRPSTNYQDFVSSQLAKIFYAMGWDLDYSLEQRKSGGASIRVSADRTRNTAKFYFEHMVRAPQARIDAWRLAKGVKNGLIPEPNSPDDFFAWEYAGGQLVTADRKFQAQTDILELENGLTTRAEIAANRSKDWEEMEAQTHREALRIMANRLDRYTEAERMAGGDQAKLEYLLNND